VGTESPRITARGGRRRPPPIPLQLRRLGFGLNAAECEWHVAGEATRRAGGRGRRVGRGRAAVAARDAGGGGEVARIGPPDLELGGGEGLGIEKRLLCAHPWRGMVVFIMINTAGWLSQCKSTLYFV